MKKPRLVSAAKVMPFSPPGLEGVFSSKMLIDKDNAGSDRLQLNHCVLKGGARMPGAAHQAPYDEIYYVLHGEAVLHMDGEDYERYPLYSLALQLSLHT